jgi:hypothetical protein
LLSKSSLALGAQAYDRVLGRHNAALARLLRTARRTAKRWRGSSI